ncbi:AI-2E family transporter [uncultured Holdemanella sp.]|jgi:predicted PurR-regulated permease PerM|uniref:AI-2E family transporter n=1 Tax=uncultured Holdemanella sp. TaxID=1763549 RepID=UPI0025EA6621|nr:AI-2E family transporter [uncultured Holdemanella sp.]
MDLHEKEKMYQRLIVFTLLIGMVIYYFEKIIGFLGWISTMCLPFLLGAGLAFVFNIISNNLMRYLIKWFNIKDTKIKRIISNVLAIFIVFAMFAAFVGIVIPRILFSIQLLLSNFPQMIYEFYIWLLDISKPVDAIHNFLQNLDINAFSSYAIDNVSKRISSWLVSGGANDIFGSIFNILSTTFSWFAQAFITIVFSFLLLFNKKQVKRETISLLKAYLPERDYEKTRHVLKLIIRVFTSYVGGTCTECLILASLVTTGALILKIPYAFLVGLVVGIGALVPMFGALVAALLCTFFIAMASPVQGLTFIIMFICIQQVEGNFIYPHVVGKSVGFPPMYIIVAITIGANVAGIFGIIIFIPICSCIYQLVSEDVLSRLQTVREVSD